MTAPPCLPHLNHSARASQPVSDYMRIILSLAPCPWVASCHPRVITWSPDPTASAFGPQLISMLGAPPAWLLFPDGNAWSSVSAQLHVTLARLNTHIYPGVASPSHPPPTDAIGGTLLCHFVNLFEGHASICSLLQSALYMATSHSCLW